MFHSAVVEKAGRAAILAGPPRLGRARSCAPCWQPLAAAVGRARPARSGARLPAADPAAGGISRVRLSDRSKNCCRISDRSRVSPHTNKARSRICARPPMRVERSGRAGANRPGGVSDTCRSARTELVPACASRAGFCALRRIASTTRRSPYCVRGAGPADRGGELHELPFDQLATAARLVDELAELQRYWVARSMPADNFAAACLRRPRLGRWAWHRAFGIDAVAGAPGRSSARWLSYRLEDAGAMAALPDRVHTQFAARPGLPPRVAGGRSSGRSTGCTDTLTRAG